MMFGIKELIEPLAAELRGANEGLIEILRGINAEQRKTNQLLEELIRYSAGTTTTRSSKQQTPKEPRS